MKLNVSNSKSRDKSLQEVSFRGNSPLDLFAPSACGSARLLWAGHQLLGEEVLELHQHLVAPVPDRRPAWTQCCTINWIPIYCVPFSCRDLRQSEELRLTISSLMMTSEWPLVKLESFCSFAGVLTRIQSRAWQRPLSSCSSLTTSSTWLAQRRLLPTTSKTSPSGLDFLTVGGFTWALHRPMVTLPPLAPKSVSSREKNLFSTSLFKQLVKKSVH